MSWFLRRRRKEKRPVAEPAATEVAHPGLFGSPSGPVDLSRSLDAQGHFPVPRPSDPGLPLCCCFRRCHRLSASTNGGVRPKLLDG